MTFELCPRCAERMDQAKAAGQVGIVLCGDCGARQAAVDPGGARKVGGPPPWRWEGVHDFLVRNGPLAGTMAYTSCVGIVDANAAPVLSVNNSDEMEIASPYVRELLRAAPEMETLLRRLIPAITAASLDDGGNYVHSAAMDALGLLQAEAAGLVSRIDATKENGR